MPHCRMVLNQSLLETIHRRGGMLPPECIHKYSLRSVIGQIQSAPTVDGNVIHFHLVDDNVIHFHSVISQFIYRTHVSLRQAGGGPSEREATIIFRLSAILSYPQ